MVCTGIPLLFHVVCIRFLICIIMWNLMWNLLNFVWLSHYNCRLLINGVVRLCDYTEVIHQSLCCAKSYSLGCIWGLIVELTLPFSIILFWEANNCTQRKFHAFHWVSDSLPSLQNPTIRLSAKPHESSSHRQVLFQYSLFYYSPPVPGSYKLPYLFRYSNRSNGCIFYSS